MFLLNVHRLVHFANNQQFLTETEASRKTCSSKYPIDRFLKCIFYCLCTFFDNIFYAHFWSAFWCILMYILRSAFKMLKFFLQTYRGFRMCVTFWWFWWCMSSCVCIVITSRTALGTIILGWAPKWLGIPRRSAGRPGMSSISSPSGGPQVYFLERLSWSSCDPIHWSTGVNLGSGSLGDLFQESLPCSLVGVISCLFRLDWALVVLWAGVRVGSDCSVSFLMIRFLDLVKGSISTDELWSCQSSSCSMT